MNKKLNAIQTEALEIINRCDAPARSSFWRRELGIHFGTLDALFSRGCIAMIRWETPEGGSHYFGGERWPDNIYGTHEAIKQEWALRFIVDETPSCMGGLAHPVIHLSPESMEKA